MLRYVSATWNAANIIDAAAAACIKRNLIHDSSWTTVIDRPGLWIVVTGASLQSGAPIPLSDRTGVVLGSLFSSDVSADQISSRVVSLDDPISQKIAGSGGRFLVSHYWGSYVFFHHDHQEERTTVFRGPMSALPCFWLRKGNLVLLFSSVEDCVDLHPGPYSINWDSIRAQAVGGDYLCTETAIQEISNVVSGECLQITAGTISSVLYWNPSNIRPDRQLKSVNEAARLMRKVTEYCIGAWAQLHSTVLLQLSGGLDSSILLSALTRAPTRPQVLSVNFWSNGSDDERKFARSMSDLTGSELVEYERNPTADFRSFLSCRLTGNPVINYSAYDTEPRLIALARQRGASAIFTGEIGDDLFGHAPAPEVLAECLETYGPGLRLLRATADYAELTRISIWNALAQATRYRAWHRRTPYWSYYYYKKHLALSDDRTLVADEVRSAYERQVSRFIHPWLNDVRGMPSGRTLLIFASIMATSTWSHSPFGGSDSGLFMMPLASQPLIESFCLIPSRLHFSQAENGAVVRNAFGANLSQAVLQRGTGKGTIDQWLQTLILQNRAFLREFLLDGVLARERILDREKVERMLSESVTRSRVGTDEIIAQLYIEGWIRQWSAGSVQAEA